MPMFMDRHEAPQVTLPEALAAHDRDASVAGKHGCRARTFWLDESRGMVNCLVEAPSKDAVIAMHAEAHGQIPSEILEVHPELVLAFLGRLDDLPKDLQGGSSRPADSSFRTILFTDLKDSTAITTRYGDARAMELIRIHNAIVRHALASHRGREVKHTGDGIMASFALAGDAVAAAVAIQRGFARHNAESSNVPLHVRIGISAGEPLCENNDLFGTCVQLAARLCASAGEDEILVSEALRGASPAVDELLVPQDARMLKGFDDPVRTFRVEWRTA